MGGGGAMRAASKVAGIGVFNGGIRAENPVKAAARKSTRPVSAVVSSSNDVKLVASSQNSKIDSSVQRPYWEIDDWEFAGGEDELFMESGQPMPRVVFGGAPTIQEAREATSELKDALEKTYLAPNTSTGFTGLVVSGQEPSMLPSKSEYLETKHCLNSEAKVIPPAPKNVIQAFRFLNESPGAQTVVASIASDANVWNAVLKNEALVEFLQSQKTSVAFSDMDTSVKESIAEADFQNQQSTKCFDEPRDSEESVFGKGFVDALENIKQNIRVTVVDIRVKVVEMMNSLSHTFQSLFGGPAGGEFSAHPDGSANGSFVDGTTLGASLIGLAVMVIMVVMLKRC